jgi:hypothetical protein
MLIYIGSSCLSSITAEPFCADSTWVLWSTPGSSGSGNVLFCCLQSQIGTTDALCVSGNTDVAASLSASMVGFFYYPVLC